MVHKRKKVDPDGYSARVSLVQHALGVRLTGRPAHVW